MRYAIPGIVLLLVGLMGAGLGRAGAGSLKAQETQCTSGTQFRCSETWTCHRFEWFWIHMGGLLFVPVRTCVDSSTEYNYWHDSLGNGSGDPSDDSPPGDLPGSGDGG